MENTVYIRKRYLLLGAFAFLFLLIIPLTVYMAQQQSQPRTNAATLATPTPQVCTQGQPPDIMLVFDTSSSMGYVDNTTTTRLQKVQAAGDYFADKFASLNSTLPAGQQYRLGVVRFADYSPDDTTIPGYDWPKWSRVVQGLTTNMSQVKTAINNLYWPDNYAFTCIECGLRQAYLGLQNSTRPKVIILLTDGIANWRETTSDWYYDPNNTDFGDLIDWPYRPNHPYAEKAAINRVNNNPGIPVYTIGVSQVNADFLQTIASKTGGVYSYTSDGTNLKSIYSDLYNKIVVGTGVISGLVYEDRNGDGSPVGDPGVPGIQITIKDGSGNIINQGTTKSDGTYSISGLCPGNYTVTESDPNGWVATTTNPVSLSLSQGQTSKFQIGIYFPFSISGKVYLDNGNGVFDSGDSVYSGTGVSIIYDTNSTPINTGSTYTKSRIPRGVHTIQMANITGYTILPARSYRIDTTTYPFAGCSKISPSSATSFGAICTGSSIQNLNFLLVPNAASTAWIQSEALDARVDKRYDFPIPSGSSCPNASVPGTSNTPGVIFSGDLNPNFGAGQASVQNWQIGNQLYPEKYADNKALKLSYDEAMTAANQTGQLKELFSQNVNMLTSGIYHVTGPLVITNPTSITGNKQIVILVSDSVDIESTVSVDKGSFLLIIANKSIDISGNIGTTPSCSATSSQLDGIYVANQDITIESAKTCLEGGDTMLQANGSFVANAGRKGGNIIQKRILCGTDSVYPPFRVTPRLDMLLSFPEFLKVTTRSWHEVAP